MAIQRRNFTTRESFRSDTGGAMTLLDNLRVVAIDLAADSALVRFLRSFGAVVDIASRDEARDKVAQADFLIESCGLRALAESNLSREWLDGVNPRLIHVSVTPFGSTGPRANWRGS